MALTQPTIFTVPEEVASNKLNRKVKSDELISFATQLSVMLDSGVVLSEALDAISDQCNPGVFKQVLEDVARRITSGDSFSSALAKYPKVFGTMFISMVRASEVSGKMSEMLEVLSGYLTADEETRKQVKGAMIYPLVMLLMSVAATGSLMFFVLPRFASIYDAKGAALPKLTQVLVNFSKVLGDAKIMTVVMTLIITGGFGVHYWRQTVSGQKSMDWLQVHLPVFGGMFIDSVLTRSMRIMSTMIKTGVSLLDTLEVMKMSCGNYYFNRLWSVTDAKIRDGYQLSDSILLAPNSELVAPGIIQMLRAGEKSGHLAEVCDKVSLFYEKKLQVSIKTATSLIEPIMIIIMGGVIGTIAIALLLPVFRISSVMAH
ncbi:MAG: type II secretion system F family protein [Planctomycetes bacterium]|nr:type II secretion system F family protein [Planctomycetota bacterium]